MLDESSSNADPEAINRRIAERVRALRQSRGWSLEALAGRCGVSRSMLSLIERGESSPTAVLLERVATGLGVMLADLFQPPAGSAAAAGQPPSPVSRADAQPVWTDPASGYQRRNLSPPGHDEPLRLVAVQFPPGATVACETAERQPPVHQQVWLLAGRLRIVLGEATHELAAGDCLAMRLDRPISFHNPGAEVAQYLVAIATATAPFNPSERAR